MPPNQEKKFSFFSVPLRAPSRKHSRSGIKIMDYFVFRSLNSIFAQKMFNKETR